VGKLLPEAFLELKPLRDRGSGRKGDQPIDAGPSGERDDSSRVELAVTVTGTSVAPYPCIFSAGYKNRGHAQDRQVDGLKGSPLSDVVAPRGANVAPDIWLNGRVKIHIAEHRRRRGAGATADIRTSPGLDRLKFRLTAGRSHC